MGSVLKVVTAIYILEAYNAKQKRFVEVCKFEEDNYPAAELNAERISQENKVAVKISKWTTTTELVKLIDPKRKNDKV